MQGRSRVRGFQILALFLLTLAAYSNSFQSGFVLDNRGLILKNPNIREASAANIGLIANHTYWWPNGESGLYRPFATLSYLFNYAVLGNGEHPAGYHSINLLLHMANVLLVFWLAARLTHRAWVAFFIAALWAVHAVLTEAVTNIVGRADLLAAAGVLAGVACYLKIVESSGSRRGLWLAALAAVTAIGVFSKESGVVVIGAILLYESTFRRKWDRALAVALIVCSLPVVWMLWQRHEVLAATQPMEIPFTDNPIAWASFPTATLTALAVIGREFRLIAWPATLSADYSWSQIPLFHGAPAEWIEVVAAIAVVLAAVLVYRWNRVAFLFFGLGLLWLAPSANILFPTGTVMAERLLYMPALGVVACVVLGTYAIAERRSRLTASHVAPSHVAAVILCVLIAALAVRTWVRNQDWRDDLTIAQASVNSSPRSFKTHDLLANVLFASDPSHANLDRVLAESEKSLAILEPLPIERKPADPYLFAANGYMLKRAYAKAIAPLVTYTAIRNTDPDAELMLSTAYLDAGDRDKAGVAAQRARELAPLNPQVYAQTAEIDASAGKLDDAAISLIEGNFVTGDKALRQDLVQLYGRAMDPGSCVLVAGPNGPAINPACPAVHQHVCAASSYVVRTLASTGQPEVAQERRRMFDEQFKCGPAAPAGGE